MYKLSFLIYISLSIVNLSAQGYSLQELEAKYTSFEYKDVVQISNDMITSGNYSSEELTKIYELKGMAHFSLGNEAASKKAFNELITLKPNYSMDPNRISPKIISFFNEIKIAHQNDIDQDRPILDSLRIIQNELLVAQAKYKSAVVKNLLFPGWGHFNVGSTTKGIIYSSLEIASLVSAITFIIKTNDTRTSYQNETNKNLISSKYDEYNSAFKTRNWLITASAIIWAVSQMDLLLISDDNFIPQNNSGNTLFSPPSELQFSISFPLN